MLVVEYIIESTPQCSNIDILMMGIKKAIINMGPISAYNLTEKCRINGHLTRSVWSTSSQCQNEWQLVFHCILVFQRN